MSLAGSMLREPRPPSWIAALRGRLPLVGLVVLGVSALAFGLDMLLVPAAAQADSDAAIAGREYLKLLYAYDAHPFWIRTHICLGIAFLVFSTLQFWRQFRNHDLKRHRMIGFVAMSAVILLPISGVVCSLVYPFAGWWGVPPNVFWAAVSLWCVVASWRAARRRDFIEHQAWITRVFGMTAGISLSRLYEPLLVHGFHMLPHVAYAVVFWLGQGEGIACAELWLRRKGGPLARRAARKPVTA